MAQLCIRARAPAFAIMADRARVAKVWASTCSGSGPKALWLRIKFSISESEPAGSRVTVADKAASLPEVPLAAPPVPDHPNSLSGTRGGHEARASRTHHE